MKTESSDNSRLPETGGEKTTALGHVGKFIDAATALVLTTASLYFWGYIYYGQFCERLGVSFQGIALPPEDYLIVNWLTVSLLLFLVGAGFVLIYLVRDTADMLVALLRRFGMKRSAQRKAEPHLHFLNAGLVVIFISGVLVAGAQFMIVQANEAADKALANRRPIVIRDSEGKAIDGQFIFLRDFGSSLLVGELDAEGKQVVAHRVLKASSFSGYSLLAPRTPAGTHPTPAPEGQSADR